MSSTAQKNTPHWSHILRAFLIELLVYGALVVVYFFLVLRILNKPLTDLYTANLLLYGLASLGLLIGQGVILDILTSFMIKLLRLDGID